MVTKFILVLIFYVQASRQASCTPCLPGLFCDQRGLLLGDTCPAGSYCPAGSTLPTPCPRGTFSNTEGLFNASACDFCTGGSYCASEGLTAPTGLCDPGHYCLSGAELPNPVSKGRLTDATLDFYYAMPKISTKRCLVCTHCTIAAIILNM